MHFPKLRAAFRSISRKLPHDTRQGILLMTSAGHSTAITSYLNLMPREVIEEIASSFTIYFLSLIDIDPSCPESSYYLFCSLDILLEEYLSCYYGYVQNQVKLKHQLGYDDSSIVGKYHN